MNSIKPSVKGLLVCGSLFLSISTESLAALPPVRSITIKPLTIYFSAMTYGLNRPCARINNIPINTYRNRTGYAASHTARNGIGYDLEMGCHITPAIEVVGELGWAMERPFKEVIVKDPFIAAFNYGFDFYKRYSYHGFLGARYYWEFTKSCNVFASAVFGFDHQKRTRAKTTSGFALSDPITTVWSSKMTLQKSHTLAGAGRVTVGCDFLFNKTWALTVFAGLEYRPHKHPSSFLVSGPIGQRIVTFRDNWRPLAFPVGASMKITF